MAEYDSSRALAVRLIDKKGRDFTYQRRTAGALADPLKPYLPADDEVEELAVRGVFIPYAVNKINGTTIMLGDQECLVAADSLGGVEPDLKDTIQDGSDVWRIMGFEVISPGAVDVLYVLQVRR